MALEHLKKRKEDLENYEKLSFNKENLQKELKILREQINNSANEITKYRNKYLNTFLNRLKFYCNSLMLNTPLISLESKAIDENGADLLCIKLKDSSIATLSAGEFNRLKLAILCINMEYKKQKGILILDEIDANLSGIESESVARILAFLAKDYQIFAISHQSHMSIFADNHYLVKRGTNNSKIELLNKEGRINEIARMISGEEITKEAILFAQNKLKHL